MFLLFLQSCRTNEGTKENTVVIKGSDTMVNLTQKWVEEYLKIHPEISLQVTGGGSGIGITALLNGTADIANMSRDLKSNELKKGEVTHIEPVQYKVALDGIALIVNPKNKIDTLTIEQIKGIYSGKIKNWKEVGGEDLEIVKYGRENSSGTYEYFKERVLGKNEKGKSNEKNRDIRGAHPRLLPAGVWRNRRGTEQNRQEKGRKQGRNKEKENPEIRIQGWGPIRVDNNAACQSQSNKRIAGRKLP